MICQLNLEPTRPNGLMGCKVATDLVKIRGGGSRGHRVAGGIRIRTKGGSRVVGPGIKSVGGYNSAEMRRPAIRSTVHTDS